MANLKFDTLWRRFLASLLDFIIVIFPLVLIGSAINDESHATILALILASHILWIGYRIIMHYRTGQTIGKRATKIIVLDPFNYDRLSFQTVLKRELFPLIAPCIGLILALLYLPSGTTFHLYLLNSKGELFLEKVNSISEKVWNIITILVALFNDKMMAPHDQFAKTIVVKIEVWDEEYRKRKLTSKKQNNLYSIPDNTFTK